MAHQENASTDRVQNRRARTGCLRCRTRRRKCDERKPRCQRCIDAEAECVYGQRLSFLQKNAFTLASDAGDGSQSRRPRESTRYSKVQFADDKAAGRKDVGRSKEASTSAAYHPSNVRRRKDEHRELPHSGGTKATSSTSSGGQQSLGLESDASYHDSGREVDKGQDVPAQNDDTSHAPENQVMGTSRGDSYGIALDVLMNLGTGDPYVNTQAAATLDLEDHAEGNSPSLPSVLKTINDLGPVSANVQSQLCSGRTIELLRHYRYKIAPWLDICDINQTFGLVIPHLATRSDMSFDALLKLCATSYATWPHARGSLRNHSASGRRSPHPSEDQVECSKMWEIKLWATLEAAEGFLTHPPGSWDDALIKNGHLHMVYSQMAESSPLRQVNENMICLLARLGVAVALLKETTPIVNSTILACLLQTSTHKRDDSSHLDPLYAYEPLVLCTKALEFIYGDIEKTTLNAEAQPRATHWQAIVNSLNDWYTDRPPTFRPIIDLNNKASPFPTLYFSSGASTLANQLYHTAMMLILAHKPRTLQLDQRRSSSLSQLWHAQRICGIAVNNNRCECWDPCLLASFYMTARQMTHEAQQREIVMGFDRVGALGWRIDGFVEQLREEWHI
ncbi:hypothetical protein V8C44DRAFT_330885 [Trichoderma aethiopicum]